MVLKTGKHADYFCYVHESPEVLTVQVHGLGKGAGWMTVQHTLVGCVNPLKH